MLRLGLCCIFKEHPVKFRRTTAKYLSRLSEAQRRDHLSRLCAHNADSLYKALAYCHENRIGAFRINSQILPLKTHPQLGYEVADLPDGDRIIEAFKVCGRFSREKGIRTTFHPDQFIVLSSPDPDVVRRSVLELEYQSQVAEWVNADVINIHGGGVYGDKSSALSRLARTIETLSDPVRQRLTLENDDRSYTPSDLLPVCRQVKVPLVYDVHHHRCLPDGVSIDRMTQACLKTWDREPLFHLSSPKEGWASSDPKKHHDFIDIRDLPPSWLPLDITVEVEAKGKELAIKKFVTDLDRMLSNGRGD